MKPDFCLPLDVLSPMQSNSNGTENANQEAKAPQITPFIVVPMQMGIFAHTSRKYRSMQILCELKMLFRNGHAIASPEVFESIGQATGIKTYKTLDKHLRWLHSNDFIHYNRRTGYIHLKSLYARFPEYKTGIRYFSGSNFKQTIFAGVTLWLKNRQVYIQKKAKSKSFIKRRAQKNFDKKLNETTGLSLNYLSTVMEYSPGRISVFKKNPQIRFPPADDGDNRYWVR